MTRHTPTRSLRFFLTAPSPCPYLPGREERKVFAHLPMAGGPGVHDHLTQGGFRRSQNIAYRPACDGCAACVSARLPVRDYVFSRSERRVLARGQTRVRHLVEAEATSEQFDLLRRYLHDRHPGGGMADIAWSDYVAMVEDTTVHTHVVEYRALEIEAGPGALLACALVDELSDGLSLVYSFFDPDLKRTSPGSFMILDHVRETRRRGLPYLYLGYWVRGSAKMDYKARFSPMEILDAAGWRLLSARDRHLFNPSP
ncbi:MAG: arginyltransferase [Caulobacteraceae bacterium]|nr:arginyltransferase [Caulobacteraceae bacterium]